MRVGEREAAVDRSQPARRGRIERRKRVDFRIGREREEPFDFHSHAVSDQREFAEVCFQRARAAAIAPIDRRHRHQRNFVTAIVSRIHLSEFILLNSSSGMTEATGTARRVFQLFDLANLGADDRRNHQLSDSISRMNLRSLVSEIHK